jgi:hypothetical protein
MKKIIGCIVLFIGFVAVGYAEDFVCHSNSRSNCGGTAGFDGYIESQNPATFSNPNCTMIPSKPGTIAASQRALVNLSKATPPYGTCHLKVVDGRAVHMDNAEKTAVNDAITADQNETVAYQNLVANNDLCNATRQELQTRKAEFLAALRTDIAAMLDITTIKAQLDDMAVKITNAFGKVIDCQRGRAGRP